MSQWTRWDEKTNTDFINMWNANVSTGLLARRYDCSKRAVCAHANILRKAGVVLLNRRNTKWIPRRNGCKKPEAA